MAGDQRIVNVVLDERLGAPRDPQVEHERRVAIHDLLEDNRFAPAGGLDGPFNLHLRREEHRLVFDVRSAADQPLAKFALPLGPLRAILRDYCIICASYYSAIKTRPASQIETIDMGRRGLHDEAGALLRERLAGRVEIDEGTARRLFTLIHILHRRG